MKDELTQRLDLARDLLRSGLEAGDLVNEPGAGQLLQAAQLAADLGIPFPPGLRPRPQPIEPRPGLDAPLPRADVVVITWTVDEVRALADVLTPGFTRDHWYRYARHFGEYVPLIRAGAPALAARRLGSYFVTEVGAKRVLCIKSELHMNQDGVTAAPFSAGHASLPVHKFLHQVIEEAQPSLVITTGTAGAVFAEHNLGDVVVTRGARFRCQKEFRDAPFNHRSFRSEWVVDTTHFAKAIELMRRFGSEIAEPEFLPPTVNFAPLTNLPRPVAPNVADIKLDGIDLPAFHPILTTDFFEFGTSTNRLHEVGAGVEMGDAVLGLVAEERANDGHPVRWLVVRNCSDPQINGALRHRPASQSQQVMWAVYYYKGFGYWTSVNGALAVWAVLAA